jgi:hypothetical protein
MIQPFDFLVRAMIRKKRKSAGNSSPTQQPKMAKSSGLPTILIP